MPIYEYRCASCSQLTEVIQKFSDVPLTTCKHCGGSLERLISAPGLHFKGSGFYITDYGRAGEKGDKGDKANGGDRGGKDKGDRGDKDRGDKGDKDRGDKGDKGVKTEGKGSESKGASETSSSSSSTESKPDTKPAKPAAPSTKSD